ncbi:hypothetical protein PD5205_00376 [Xanthomonas fragariae]|uniref:Uncharacterized protein n=1 Tax=Xanthomonas fragariae TaxID=48664 RepID=A0A1Y6HBG7_9XANT|nr:hypothetical protein PD885_03634 [Xanthomonas fragariae]SMR01696.1 hypothetical protein PD5205_00376 [Xanthomonas fragariae]
MALIYQGVSAQLDERNSGRIIAKGREAELEFYAGDMNIHAGDPW